MILTFYVMLYHIKCLSLFPVSELSLLVRLQPKLRNCYEKETLSAHFSNLRWSSVSMYPHYHWCCSGGGKSEEVSPQFWSRVRVLGPSCERFDGWLSSVRKNNLSPASQAKGTRLCVSIEEGRAPIHHSGMWRCCVGLLRATGHAWLGGPVERLEVN